jgi:hypothetical protein
MVFLISFCFLFCFVLFKLVDRSVKVTGVGLVLIGTVIQGVVYPGKLLFVYLFFGLCLFWFCLFICFHFCDLFGLFVWSCCCFSVNMKKTQVKNKNRKRNNNCTHAKGGTCQNPSSGNSKGTN